MFTSFFMYTIDSILRILKKSDRFSLVYPIYRTKFRFFVILCYEQENNVLQ